MPTDNVQNTNGKNQTSDLIFQKKNGRRNWKYSHKETRKPGDIIHIDQHILKENKKETKNVAMV